MKLATASPHSSSAIAKLSSHFHLVESAPIATAIGQLQRDGTTVTPRAIANVLGVSPAQLKLPKTPDLQLNITKIAALASQIRHETGKPVTLSIIARETGYRWSTLYRHFTRKSASTATLFATNGITFSARDACKAERCIAAQYSRSLKTTEEKILGAYLLLTLVREKELSVSQGIILASLLLGRQSKLKELGLLIPGRVGAPEVCAHRSLHGRKTERRDSDGILEKVDKQIETKISEEGGQGPWTRLDSALSCIASETRRSSPFRSALRYGIKFSEKQLAALVSAIEEAPDGRHCKASESHPLVLSKQQADVARKILELHQRGVRVNGERLIEALPGISRRNIFTILNGRSDRQGLINKLDNFCVAAPDPSLKDLSEQAASATVKRLGFCVRFRMYGGKLPPEMRAQAKRELAPIVRKAVADRTLYVTKRCADRRQKIAASTNQKSALVRAYLENRVPAFSTFGGILKGVPRLPRTTIRHFLVGMHDQRDARTGSIDHFRRALQREDASWRVLADRSRKPEAVERCLKEIVARDEAFYSWAEQIVNAPDLRSVRRLARRAIAPLLQ